MPRRYQFSLKSLFVVSLVFAIAFSLGLQVGQRIERERLENERQSLADQRDKIEAEVEEGANFRAFLLREEKAGRLPMSPLSPSIQALPDR